VVLSIQQVRDEAIGCRENLEQASGILNPMVAMPPRAQKAEKAVVHGPASSPPAANPVARGELPPNREPAANEDSGSLESRLVRLPFGRMHFYAGGTPSCRRPVILIHGFVIASRYMIPTARHLAPLCRVYAVDLPGYGWSDKPGSSFTLPELADSLAEWMNAMSIQSAHFAANSFGCQVLSHLAVRHPQRIDRLVFQGPTVDPAARSLLGQVWRIIRNSRQESPRLGWLMAKDYWHAGIERIVATVRMALDDRIEERLPLITAPSLIVRGSRDPLVPQAWAETVARLLPNGRLVTLPGCGHTINYTSSAEFVGVMQPFLRL
jgi:pimeloyl-ACP methyl ester carboxylesterase